MISTQKLITILKLSEIFLVTSTLILFYQATNNFQLVPTISNIGIKYGEVSVIFLGFSLLPGIIRRFSILPQILKFLQLIRRHLGILMYLFGLSHYLLNYVSVQLLAGDFPPNQIPPVFILMGLFGLLLYTPLFLTSNDLSVRLLKRNWSKLHKLTHLGVVLILLHLVLQSSKWAFPAGLLLLLTSSSYIIPLIRKSSSDISTLKE